MPAPMVLVFASTRRQALQATDRLGLPRNRAHDYGSMGRALRGRGKGSTAVLADARLADVPLDLAAFEASGGTVVGIDEYEGAAA